MKVLHVMHEARYVVLETPFEMDPSLSLSLLLGECEKKDLFEDEN